MERLTNGIDYCELHCDFGKSNECFFSNKDKCYERSIYNRLKEYEDAEEQGLLLRLPCKDELISILAKLVLNSQFGWCYMCTNPMKNITLDGVNNGCDGCCNNEKFTTDDLIKKVVEELRRKSESEQKLKEMEDK